MVRCRLKELAEHRGLKLSHVQQKSGHSMPVIRRYWYSTANGKRDGDPLVSFNSSVLVSLCELLGIEIGDLLVIEHVQPGTLHPRTRIILGMSDAGLKEQEARYGRTP